MTDLVIAHLYPDLLRTYGDRDNVSALSRRAEWRGFSVRVEEVGLGEALPSDAHVIVLGGGTDSVQAVVGLDLASRADDVRAAVDRGTVVFGVCGGFQLLGSRYVLPDGRVIPGMGVLDVETRASNGRLVGRVKGTAHLWGRSFDLVGFENHSGRTTLGPGVDPLAIVHRGHGNNGRDRGDGACQRTVVGTYLHGPVLALNPELTDGLLERALATSQVAGGSNRSMTPSSDELTSTSPGVSATSRGPDAGGASWLRGSLRSSRSRRSGCPRRARRTTAARAAGSNTALSASRSGAAR